MSRAVVYDRAMSVLPTPAEKEQHGWYAGRRSILAAELDRLGPLGVTLDVGCGAGMMLDELAPRASQLFAVDPDPIAVDSARARGVAELTVAPAEALPFPDATFDLVTAFDVLEHTDDDVQALRELRRVTRGRGRLLVAVPALPRLWSSHDVAAQHRRRYTRRSLAFAAAQAGWVAGRSTYFNTLLLPPMAAVRAATRNRPPRTDLLRASGPVSLVLEPALRLEAHMLRTGLRLPLGLSLLMLLEPR